MHSGMKRLALEFFSLLFGKYLIDSLFRFDYCDDSGSMGKELSFDYGFTEKKLQLFSDLIENSSQQIIFLWRGYV
jgi:hypothetical protein